MVILTLDSQSLGIQNFRIRSQTGTVTISTYLKILFRSNNGFTGNLEALLGLLSIQPGLADLQRDDRGKVIILFLQGIRLFGYSIGSMFGTTSIKQVPL